MRELGKRTLALCGKSWIAVEALDLVCALLPAVAPQWRAVALPVATDGGEDTWEPSFRRRCALHGVPVVGSIEALDMGAADVLICLQYDRIIRMPALNAARGYNLHFSALPAHRGCYPAVWPIRDGDTHAGVTLHVLTSSIDDGAIVDQALFEIPRSVTSYELYRLLHREALAVFARSLQALLKGTVHLRDQPPTSAVYHDRHSIDFGQRELHAAHTRSVDYCDRFLRSLIFPPRQLPLVEGREVLSCQPVRWNLQVSALPGVARHIDIADDACLIRCLDGWLLLRLRGIAKPTAIQPDY